MPTATCARKVHVRKEASKAEEPCFTAEQIRRASWVTERLSKPASDSDDMPGVEVTWKPWQAGNGVAKSDIATTYSVCIEAPAEAFFFEVHDGGSTPLSTQLAEGLEETADYLVEVADHFRRLAMHERILPSVLQSSTIVPPAGKEAKASIAKPVPSTDAAA